jgi:RNA polymerase sigma factor (TIGR02999 family)
MHRILVEHARKRLAERRGGGKRPLDVSKLDVAEAAPPEELIALHDALGRLSEVRRNIVELRFFAGLTVDQTAEALGMPPRSVDREWAYIRAWLHRELSA